MRIASPFRACLETFDDGRVGLAVTDAHDLKAERAPVASRPASNLT